MLLSKYEKSALMTLKITKPNKNKILLKRIVFWSLIPISFSSLLFNSDYLDAIAPLYVTLTIMWLAANFYFHFIVMPFDVVGYVKLSKNSVNYMGNILKLQDIASIGIIYYAINGESAGFRGFAILYGDNNVIQIKTKDGLIFKDTFLLESKIEVRTIIKYLEYYENQNINVQFYSKRDRKYYF